MIIETSTIYAFSALLLVMLIITVYFSIFFMIFYIIGWGVAQIFKPIIKIISHI